MWVGVRVCYYESDICRRLFQRNGEREIVTEGRS